MLQDVTAEKYGLDNTAVPNDVFNLLCDSPEHIGDLKQSLRADIGDPWLLCNGEQFRTDDYPELAKLCNKELTKYQTLYDLGKIVEETHPGYARIFQIIYVKEKGKWYVYSSNKYDGDYQWNYFRLTIVDAATGAAEGHEVKILSEDYSFYLDYAFIAYNNGQFASMHPLDNNKAPLILWSTDGYNFKAETFGNGLASDYQYWTFDYLIAYNGEFVGEAIYRWSNGYECRVFHAPTIEEFINVSTYQATKTTITNSWSPLPNANEWYERTEQYGQAIVEMVWSDNSTWCPHTLIDAALKPHYFDSAEYTRDTGTTVNVNNGVTFRKIGKYFFMFSKYGRDSQRHAYGYCDTYNGTYKYCPMVKAFNNLDFDYDEESGLYYRYQLSENNLQLVYATSLTDTTVTTQTIATISGDTNIIQFWKSDPSMSGLLSCKNVIVQNPTGDLESPVLPTISDSTHYTYVKAKDR